MESISYSYPAAAPAARRAVVGVVGSGDLEVLLEPAHDGAIRIDINTSVSGRQRLWQALLDRLFAAGALPAARLEINDCGATPGVARLRIEQAFEEGGLFEDDAAPRREGAS